MNEWWLMHWGASWLPPSERVVWGWPIATAYVFAGSGGTIMALAAWEAWCRRTPALSRIGLVAGALCVLVGAGILVLDLGVPWRFLNLIIAIPSRIMSSPMTWGVFVLGALPIVGLYSVMMKSSGRFVSGTIIVLGILTAVYPGFLLNATSIALWNSYLPLLFLFTSLSAGAAFMALASGLLIVEPTEGRASVHRMENIAAASTAAELIIVVLFLLAAANDGRALPSLQALLGASVGRYFWSGIGLTLLAGIGLLFTTVPSNRRGQSGPGSLAAAFAVAASGSFLLRVALFLAGFAAFTAVSPFGAYSIQLP